MKYGSKKKVIAKPIKKKAVKKTTTKKYKK